MTTPASPVGDWRSLFGSPVKTDAAHLAEVKSGQRCCLNTITSTLLKKKKKEVTGLLVSAENLRHVKHLLGVTLMQPFELRCEVAQHDVTFQVFCSASTHHLCDAFALFLLQLSLCRNNVPLNDFRRCASNRWKLLCAPSHRIIVAN